MILDMDAGNTRLKWVLHEGDIDGETKSGFVAREQVPTALACFDLLPIERVRLSSVAGDSTDAICAWGARRDVVVEVARVVDGAAGLVCGYMQPDRLGIDRWLALLAARRLCSGSYAVADAGTALTLDVVDKDGIHLGGFIVPGLQMMMDSLGANTWGIKVDDISRSTVAAGTSTSEAVANGCLAAAVGLIEKIMSEYRCDNLFLTGGDATRLADQFKEMTSSGRAKVAVCPHLVLAGLSVALP